MVDINHTSKINIKMNLHYISGFFDADGSITLSKNNKKDLFKTIKIDFTNTYVKILKEIQKYFLEEYSIKTFISTKPSKKINHNTGYTLSCSSNQQCIKICKLLESKHPKKIHRINTILKYHDLVTVKNGKYSIIQHNRKLAYERLFFNSSFH